MKNIRYFFAVIIIALVSIIIKSCDDGSVKDIDKNVYRTTKIGQKDWLTKNLDVSRFRNGDIIPEAKTDEEWEKYGREGKPAWCYYDNNPENGRRYGKLYNWYAVNDPRGLAPKGWRIPSEEEWSRVIRRQGGEMNAGDIMKSTSGWESYEGVSGNGSNKSHFSALPGGYREASGNFSGKGYNANWWAATKATEGYANYLLLSYQYNLIYRLSINKARGLSVRCVRDAD